MVELFCPQPSKKSSHAGHTTGFWNRKLHFIVLESQAPTSFKHYLLRTQSIMSGKPVLDGHNTICPQACKALIQQGAFPVQHVLGDPAWQRGGAWGTTRSPEVLSKLNHSVILWTILTWCIWRTKAFAAVNSNSVFCAYGFTFTSHFRLVEI